MEPFFEDCNLVSDFSDNEEDNMPLASLTKKLKMSPISSDYVNKKTSWKRGDLEKVHSENDNSFQFSSTIIMGPDSHPMGFFELMVTKNAIDTIVKFTKNYAAILLLSGYVPLPRRRMFWEESEDIHNPLVAHSMRRNRFEEIISVIHMADNDALSKDDKFIKLRPFAIIFAPIESSIIVVDESMIPYYGRHGCKQFIRGKPIRFGNKAWVAALKSGYCLQIDLYQGRKDAKGKQHIGLCESVVMNFANILKQHYPKMKFSLFFDIFLPWLN